MNRCVRFFILFTFLVLSLTARGKEKTTTVLKPAGAPTSTLMNINAISAWYSANGESERIPATGNSGLTFPFTASTAIYCSGLMMGAIATDGVSSGPRVNGFNYYNGFQAGAILGTRTGAIEDTASPSVRIFRVRRDFATADLLRDAAELNYKPAGEVSAADIEAVRLQYKKDWQEWPVSKGAPFYDADHDGIYTPQFEMVDGKEVPKHFPAADEPGLAQADQVVWYVCNDIGTGQSPWKTKPMGIEQQVTIWGYASGGAMQNTLFKRYRLIYKGTAVTPDTAKLTNMYVSQWSDPDLGDAGDDFVGIDTTIDLGYVYNSKTLDAEYKKFNMVPPSVGYTLLQGPSVPSPGDTAIIDLKRKQGFRNLPTTSFQYFAAGGAYSDPPFTANGSIQWYQMLRGLYATPQGPPDPAPMIDPVTNLPTKYQLSGDPVTRTGWIDGTIDNPGDRRMLQNSGPFTMALNDTQEIVFAVVGGIGTDNINSITDLRSNVRTVRSVYRSLFTIIPPNLTASVTYPVSGEAEIRLRASGPVGAFTAMNAAVGGKSVDLFDDGNHQDSLAGDGIFGAIITVPRAPLPASVDMTIQPKNRTPIFLPHAIEAVTIAGPFTITQVKILFENVKDDGAVNNGEYVEFQLNLLNGTGYELSDVRVSAGISTPYITEVIAGPVPAGTEVTTSALTPFVLRLPISFASSTIDFPVAIHDGNGNRWETKWTFPVVHRAVPADTVTVPTVSVVGKNDALLKTVLYDPAAAGHVYQVWFQKDSYGKLEMTTIDPAAIRLTGTVVPINTIYPRVAGTGAGEFLVDPQKSQMTYSIVVQNSSSPVTGAGIAVNTVYNPAVTTLSMPKTNTFAGTWAIPDSLKDELVSGSLYVIVTTEEHPSGALYCRISDGATPRIQIGPRAYGPYPPFFQATENRLPGVSLYVVPPPLSLKSIEQTAPTAANVRGAANPEGTYRVFEDSLSIWDDRFPVGNVEIRFQPGENWALAIPSKLYPIPSDGFPIRVPFAAYFDTTRVWPVIVDAAKDSVWNTAGNILREGKPMFDTIYSIVYIRDFNTNSSLTYYSTGIPTTNTVKGRLLIKGNAVIRNLYVMNESGDGKPPIAGTTIRMKPYLPINSGDITSFTVKTLGVPMQGSSVPENFSLSQNFPNPFNPSTTIEFAVPHRADVAMKIYDVVGREVATLVRGMYEPGRYRITWDGRSASGRPVSSGVYFCRLTSGTFAGVKKLLLIK